MGTLVSFRVRLNSIFDAQMSDGQEAAGLSVRKSDIQMISISSSCWPCHFVLSQ